MGGGGRKNSTDLISQMNIFQNDLVKVWAFRIFSYWMCINNTKLSTAFVHFLGRSTFLHIITPVGGMGTLHHSVHTCICEFVNMQVIFFKVKLPFEMHHSTSKNFETCFLLIWTVDNLNNFFCDSNNAVLFIFFMENWLKHL